MHYFIDGYNLLFRLLHGQADLQSQRELIIRDLNQKVSLLKLDISIVFDSTLPMGERTRSHYDEIEILFTAQSETADEYILEEISNHPHPQTETVVTSDKALASRIRNRSARTESVEEFILWLNKAYKNKIRQRRKEKRTLHSAASPPSPPKPSLPLTPSPHAPLEAYADYYAQIFESKWQENLKQEKKRTQQSPTTPHPRRFPSRQPKRRQDPFALPPTPEEKAATERERWQQIFEKRLKHGPDFIDD